MDPRPTDPRQLGLYYAMAHVGLEMVAPIGLGLLVDHYFSWSPWGVVVGAFLGLFGGLWHLLRMVDRLNRLEPPQEKDK